MTRAEATEIISQALDALIKDDYALLDLKVCERALHFRIAHYMTQSRLIQPPLTLDCEYNRHYRNEKLLYLSNGTKLRKVFPDILVHERNSDQNNMVAVEIKRPGQSLSHDQEKLRGFVYQLGYRHAGHIIIGHNRENKLVRDVIWIDD